jgi:hypothetical protein
MSKLTVLLTRRAVPIVARVYHVVQIWSDMVLDVVDKSRICAPASLGMQGMGKSNLSSCENRSCAIAAARLDLTLHRYWQGLRHGWYCMECLESMWGKPIVPLSM